MCLCWSRRQPVGHILGDQKVGGRDWQHGQPVTLKGPPIVTHFCLSGPTTSPNSATHRDHLRVKPWHHLFFSKRKKKIPSTNHSLICWWWRFPPGTDGNQSPEGSSNSPNQTGSPQLKFHTTKLNLKYSSGDQRNPERDDSQYPEAFLSQHKKVQSAPTMKVNSSSLLLINQLHSLCCCSYRSWAWIGSSPDTLS